MTRHAPLFDPLAASHAALCDITCDSCGDDPCRCRECEPCGARGHIDDMHRIGDDYRCDGCHDLWLAEQASWVGMPRIAAGVRRAS